MSNGRTPPQAGASLAPAIVSLVALGAAWAILSLGMAASGAIARAVWLPVDPARYHAAQAVFVGPWLALLGTAFVALARALSGRAGAARFRDSWAALVPVWASATLLLFVLPDLVVLGGWGVGAMPRAMRVYGPLAPAAIVWLGGRRLAALHGVGRGRASLAVLGALLGQTALAALLLR